MSDHSDYGREPDPDDMSSSQDSADTNPRDDRSWIPESAMENLAMERSLNPTESEEALARRLFRESAPQAAMSILHSAIHSPSERVRLDASKYVIERVLGRVGDDAYHGDKSPLEDFLNDVVEKAEAYANNPGNGSDKPKDNPPKQD